MCDGDISCSLRLPNFVLHNDLTAEEWDPLRIPCSALRISFACKFRQATDVLDAKVLCATAYLLYNQEQRCPFLPAQALLKKRNQMCFCHYLPQFSP